MNNIYAIYDKAGNYLYDIEELTFINLTEQEIILDASNNKHLNKYGYNLFANANSDYILGV